MARPERLGVRPCEAKRGAGRGGSIEDSMGVSGVRIYTVGTWKRVLGWGQISVVSTCLAAWLSQGDDRLGELLLGAL